MSLLPWREETKRRGRFTLTLPSPIKGEGFWGKPRRRLALDSGTLQNTTHGIRCFNVLRLWRIAVYNADKWHTILSKPIPSGKQAGVDPKRGIKSVKLIVKYWRG